MFSRNLVWVKLQIFRHMSDPTEIMLPNELHSKICLSPLCPHECLSFSELLNFQHHLFFMDKFEEATAKNLLKQCYVLHHNIIFDMDMWAPAHTSMTATAL